MRRLSSLWDDLTEGNSIAALWLDFRRDARSAFEASAPRLSLSGTELHGWRRIRAFVLAMFFQLTPARRVLLLLGLIQLVAFGLDSRGDAAADNVAGGLILSTLCVLTVLVLEVADRVSMKRDLEVARDIQSWLVPKEPPCIPGLDIAFATRPANTVAGDYYDVLTLPRNASRGPAFLFVVADVAGKGIPAGLLMACFRTCLHTLAASTGPLCALVAALNRFCAADSNSGRRFTTAFFAEYDPASGALSYVNAGHNPPMLRRASGTLLELEGGGLPCGVLAETPYTMGQTALGPGDLLLIYTDGVIEAVNDSGVEFGMERLRQFVLDTFAAPELFQQRLFASISAFTGGARQFDDVTCMVVQAKPQTPLPSDGTASSSRVR